MLYQFPGKIENAQGMHQSLRNGAGVIVFGSGNCGALVLAALKKANIKVIGLADNNESRWNQTYLNFKVMAPDQLLNWNKNTPVLVASVLNFPFILRQLRNLGLTNILDCDFILSELDLDISECEVTWSKEKIKQKIDTYIFSVMAQKQQNNALKVNGVDLVLTEKCSLKCKDCSNLMQYYAKPVDEDFDQLISSIDTFFTTVDYVHQIRLIGGEPLMYKKIDLVIQHLLTYNNYDSINIYTNGTIVPNDEKMKVFEHKKIFFDISDYGTLSRNLTPLLNELDKRNIKHNSQRVTTWQDCGRIVTTDRSDSENKSVFGNCCENQGLTILHGKLYLCPFSAHATNLDAIPFSSDDIVNLGNDNKFKLKSQIKKLYFETEFLEACKSCNGRHPNVTKVEAALQTKKPLSFMKTSDSNSTR